MATLIEEPIGANDLLTELRAMERERQHAELRLIDERWQLALLTTALQRLRAQGQADLRMSWGLDEHRAWMRRLDRAESTVDAQQCAVRNRTVDVQEANNRVHAAYLAYATELGATVPVAVHYTAGEEARIQAQLERWLA